MEEQDCRFGYTEFWASIGLPHGDVQRVVRWLSVDSSEGSRLNIQIWVHYVVVEAMGQGHLMKRMKGKEWVMEIIDFPSYLAFSCSFSLFLIKQYNLILINKLFWKIKYACGKYSSNTKGYAVNGKSPSLLISSNPGPISRGIPVSSVFWKSSKPVKQFYINVSTLCLPFYIILLKII